MSYKGSEKYSIRELKRYIDMYGLDRLTAKHIKQLLKARGCKGYTGMSKDELMAFYRMECEKYASDVDALRVEAKRMGIPGTGDMKTRELIRRIVKFNYTTHTDAKAALLQQLNLSDRKIGSEVSIRELKDAIKLGKLPLQSMSVPELRHEAKQYGVVINRVHRHPGSERAKLINVLSKFREGYIIPELLSATQLREEAKRLGVSTKFGNTAKMIRLKQLPYEKMERLRISKLLRNVTPISRDVIDSILVDMIGVSLDAEPRLTEQKQKRKVHPSFFEHLYYAVFDEKTPTLAIDDIARGKHVPPSMFTNKILGKTFIIFDTKTGDYEFFKFPSGKTQRDPKVREIATAIASRPRERYRLRVLNHKMDQFMHAMSKLTDPEPQIIVNMRKLKKKAQQAESRALAASKKAQAAANRATALSRALSDECPICYDTLKHPTTTRCGHTFCADCLDDYVQYKQRVRQPPACPMCRKRL